LAAEIFVDHVTPEEQLTFIFGKLVWAVLQPGNLLMLCLLGGILLFLVSRSRRGKVLVGVSALGFLLLAVAPVGPAMLYELEARFPRPHSMPQRVDGIIILGGAVDPELSRSYGETVFNRAVTRVLAGVALARRYPDAKVALVSGEGEFFPVGFSESRATLSFVLEEGIASSRVVLEERSRSTHENAVYAKEMIRPAPDQIWILVTSAYQMPRAVACFEAVGWPVIPYPVDFRIDPETGLRANFNLLDGLSASTLAGKEWIGLVGYRLMGWTQDLFPAPEGVPVPRDSANRG
jgi:uncharacterized SAM-binding protein YcdF (DUF218 family)